MLGSEDLTKNLKYVGYVPQSAQARDVNMPFSVFETVMLGRTPQAGLFHGTGAKDRQKVEEALKLFGIFDLKDRKIGQLSGGQSQRVFLAKAMVADPKLLLLDEPPRGVDTTSKTEFYQTLERLNKETGITVVLCSHDIGVITKNCKQSSVHKTGLSSSAEKMQILTQVPKFIKSTIIQWRLWIMLTTLDILTLLQAGFVQRAFIISIIIAVLDSVLSIFIVLKKISLIGDGLAHTAFGGIALGYAMQLVLGVYLQFAFVGCWRNRSFGFI